MVTDTSPVTVYVPAAATPGTSRIRSRSGIVGSAGDSGRVLVDYEGDLYGPTEQFQFWADRVHHAWGRHVDRYPIVARALLAADELTAVGSYDPLNGVVTVDDDHVDEVLAWLQLPGRDELAAQCETHSVARHQQRREIRAALAVGHLPRAAIADHARRFGHEDLLG